MSKPLLYFIIITAFIVLLASSAYFLTKDIFVVTGILSIGALYGGAVQIGRYFTKHIGAYVITTGLVSVLAVFGYLIYSLWR